MKIDVYVLCKNEIKLAPFFIDYWQALADDVNVYVFDGLSTDGTRELFAQYSWIHVIDFEPDALDDVAHAALKNNCWKAVSRKNGADFVMVCDFDETIFSYDVLTLRQELQFMKDNGYTILAPLSFNLIPDEFPKYEKGRFMHEVAEYGFNDSIWEAKPILFDPTKIDNFNTRCGGHYAAPTGKVNWYISDKLFLIHAKFLGFDFYTERIRNRVVSERNLQLGMDGETKRTLENMQNHFNEYKAVRFKWSDIQAHFNEYYQVKIDWRKWGGMYVKNDGLDARILKDKPVIISMTSWPKRIQNVAVVIMSLLKNIISPDLIELNLSLDEFPNKEKDLPQNLLLVVNNYTNISINWVEGNTGVFKKIIPTLKKYYGNDYYLFSCDDDYIYREDYIQIMLGYMRKANCDSFCLSSSPIIGNRTVYKSKVFESDFWENLTQEVIDTRIDDRWIENYLPQKGVIMGYYRPDDVKQILAQYNEVSPNSEGTSKNPNFKGYDPSWVIRSYNLIDKYKFNQRKEE